jgi:hypothetical protein
MHTARSLHGAPNAKEFNGRIGEAIWERQSRAITGSF